MGVASLSGRISIGATTSPDLNILIAAVTPTINENILGRTIIAHNLTDQSISFQAIAGAQFAFIRCKDASGNPRWVTPAVNGVALLLPRCTEFYWVIGAAPTTSVTSIHINTQAAGGDTVIEYGVAGAS